MKTSFLVVSAVVGAITVGVYYGLGVMFPPQSAEEAVVAPPPPPAPTVDLALDEPPPAEPEAPAEEVAEPEPAPEPEPPKPAVRQAPVQVAKAQETYQGAAKAAPPAADHITPWWPDPAKMAPAQLKLKYAGQTQGASAIALLFSAPLNPESLNTNVEVRDAGGNPVSGAWEVAKNPKMATFKVAGTGRYTVILQASLADSTGHLLGTLLQGPVYIQ